jgi:hypothetical protein
MLCVDKYRTLLRADHSSRGVLPSVVCVTEGGRGFLDNEEALAHWRALAPWKNRYWLEIVYLCIYFDSLFVLIRVPAVPATLGTASF